ncbi:MAG: transcriptional repressor [Firmicutes bacterium]|nr:transcriptional repressor [Bacillota bacterium]
MRNKRLKDIKEKLAARDYRLTPQRELILEIFAENSDRHLSAEEIYDLIRQKNPDIGLATVYRTLELLEDLKVIQSINFGDGCARYEFTGDRHHHHHLICLECGEVEEVDEDLLEKLEQSIEEKHGFRITDHQVKFYGICRRCQEKFATT